MADSSFTVGELFKAKAVTDEQVNAAVEAYLADPETSAYRLTGGYSINLLDAVSRHSFSQQVLSNPNASQPLKRDAVRTAILLARVQKA
ncbi:hypothetical protein [Methylorubrum extorquens]|uniref:hypothetical protein n=1 Tax=Methylorubrum extorquens TaxID=408 RepID=UPI00209E3CBA|nr:hypothetical protein [Methylorubrum extorquens]MCP1539024.1 hypothetical protein [Methylorubrum extorquens]